MLMYFAIGAQTESRGGAIAAHVVAKSIETFVVLSQCGKGQEIK